ncbi:methyltransferase domain-containing protein [Novosphingobium sp. BL-52-GroH]|uniref:methyltransferase domain-containing protein n=1 Tax=Novosphingobium sp. BL-52-GroH TaxID=3349877 RepID=UPI00384FC183
MSAGKRGIANIAGCVAPAERLPFVDGAFDFISCRFSAHHWTDFEAGAARAESGRDCGVRRRCIAGAARVRHVPASGRTAARSFARAGLHERGMDRGAGACRLSRARHAGAPVADGLSGSFMLDTLQVEVSARRGAGI